MSSLFKNLRIHQVFGANTDVGKTILTTALVKASTSRNTPVFYLKPVSTGSPQDADDGHIKRYATSNLVHTDCFFRCDEPVSPHLAAKLKTTEDGPFEIPSDRTIVDSIANRIRQYASRDGRYGHVYMETAGGVHSPSLSGTTQADCYRPLFLPTILIGDSRLGGISSTISSYESLLLRGYIIDAVLLFRDDYYRNWEYLEPYFAEKGIHLAAVDAPPPRLAEPSADQASTQEYYTNLVKDDSSRINTVLDHLDKCHTSRQEELASMPKRTLDTIWWPFVQHGLAKDEADVTVIDSAFSDFFSVYRPSKHPDQSLLSPEFDGSASWWTQTVGHAHPSLTLAVARASGRYGHVMFPQATHLPALKLAERLVHDGPGKGWASRAFFSDNGSTGMEVALKMALRAYCVRNHVNESDKKRLGVLGLNGSYHGDTIGVMDACAEGVYSCEWHEAKGFWFEPPSIGITDGQSRISLTPALQRLVREQVIPAPSLSWIYDVESRLQTSLAGSYRAYIEDTLKQLEAEGQKLGALVLEPLVMGAGGMIFVDPLFQRVMVDVVRGRTSSEQSSAWNGLPVIFDEVFVGLQRIGMESSGPLLGVYPDISVNAKILTGGLVPLAVTLASDSIFEAFLGDSKATALLHGHSYTAHAIGCEVANETLNMIDTLKTSQEWRSAKTKWSRNESPKEVWSFWDPGFVQAVSRLSAVEKAMALGCVLAIKLKSYVSMSAQALFSPLRNHVTEADELSAAPGGAPFSTHYRTLGDVAYFMTSLNTHSAVVRSMEDKIWAILSRA
ncbi:Bifunctional dethiobiotin synthetase/7,8-diamino-pelargonic acid aminotransferase, mitochondrial [Leucoagaricus sp. SymC.cos]|nr:Bifunctional dethiobiotin synthetase/7,8-diamino-pelargonic acid aminotransferase, mitochondrial [Leucoagaricus sp. SymC.cos]